MSRITLGQELKDWIGDEEKRVTFMIEEAPIGASTLRATVTGRYNPSALLERAIRAVMHQYPKGKPIPTRRKEAVG